MGSKYGLPSWKPNRERSAPLIVKYLENVGIKVDLRQPKEMSVYVEGLTKDNKIGIYI